MRTIKLALLAWLTLASTALADPIWGNGSTDVPGTRNVNTSAPLGGGGALSADLTLTCATCTTATSTFGADNVIVRSDGTGRATQSTGVTIDDSNRLGLGTAVPTHTVTHASGSTGVVAYNTADQTTNYERLLGSWGANVYTLYTEKGGSGTQRAFRVGSSAGYIETGSSSGTYTFGGAGLARLWTQSAATFQFANSITTQTVAGFEFTGLNSLSATSGTQTWFKVNPTLNQATGSAATDILRIEPTLTAVGSGGADAISVAPGGTESFRVTTGGQAVVNASTAPPASGAATSCILVSSTANLGYCWGSGAPTFSAAQGTFYLRTDGSSTSTRLYVNTNGTTGWTNVVTGT